MLVLHRLAWQFGVPSVRGLAHTLTYPDLMLWCAFIKIQNEEQEKAMKG